MLDMIGVGPFITLPLILSAMGGPQAMLGWILGAGLAICDGLVWAELGAAMPEAGGSYAFLRRIYSGASGTNPLGRFLAFLFVFQLCLSAPLSVASGCIGLGQYAAYLCPSLSPRAQIFIAASAVVLAVFLLYRGLASLRIAAAAMWTAVMALIAWILITGALHGHFHQAVTLPPHAFTLTPAFFLGLGSAMLVATYDFWGYYNITFLGAEVEDPAHTVPRAILISIALVAALYLAMNVSVLAVLPWQQIASASNIDARRAVISIFMESAYGPHLGPTLGKLAALLVIVTAFASVFSLLLGYSRIPYAAARDGNFFPAFARLHRKGFPHISLLYLGAAAICFCFFSLAHVIAALVVLRILLQFLMQHIGVLYLRRTQPGLPRPFRIWLYPLPPVLAICGFIYILVERANFQRELLGAGLAILLGASLYWLREKLRRG